MKNVVERISLSPGLEISRVLTGLWQIAEGTEGINKFKTLPEE